MYPSFPQHRSQIIKLLIPTLVLSVTYYTTAARHSLGYADSDELLLTSFMLGVPHHPGYPLFTLIGYLATHIPLPLSVAYKGNLMSATFQAINIGLIIYLFNILNLAKKKYLTSIIPLAIGLGLTREYWFFASTYEVFPLNNFFVILYLIFFTHSLNKKSKKAIYACYVVFGFGLAHHPIFRIFALPTLYLLWQHRNNIRFILLQIALTVSAFIASYSIFIFFANDTAPLSWPFPKSLEGIWQAFNYTIYTDTGSAVETYTKEFNLKHSLDSLLIYGKYVLHDFGLITTLISVAGIVMSIKVKHIPIKMITTLWLLSGPILAMYMKFPYPDISDTGYYFGTLLRFRMLVLSQLLLIIIAIFGVTKITEDIEKKFPKYKSIYTLTMIGIVVLVMNLISNNPHVKNNNFAPSIAAQVLVPLPANDILFVDDDFVFTLLYEQYVNHLRPDITIIPTTWQITSNKISQNRQKYLGYVYSDHNSQIANAIAWQLFQGNSVSTYAIEPEILELLGGNGNPFYIYANGYTLQIMTKPRDSINQTSYEISQNLASSQLLPRENWQRGWQGSLSYIHTTAGFYSAIHQQPEISQINFELALTLAQLSHNKQTILQTKQYVSTIANTKNQLNVTESNLYMEALQSPEINQKIQLARSALLKNPEYLPAHVLLSQLYTQLGYSQMAQDHQNIINQLTTNEL